MKAKSAHQGRVFIAFLALAGIACVLWTINHYTGAAINETVLAVTRWIAIAAFCAYAWVRRSLTTWIMVGILLGAEVGHEFPAMAKNLQVFGAIFLRLIRTIIAPLIFATLVVGIAGHSNLKQVGRMGIKALIYFELVTTVALFIGLGAINLSRAGVGVRQPANAPPATSVQKQSAADLILHVFPENIAKSVAENQVLQVVVFSIIFGIALAQVGEKRRRTLVEFFEIFSETMFKFTNIVMLFAPIGVGGAIAYTVSTMGFDVMWNLIKLVLTLYAALVVFVLCVLVPVALIARLDLRRLFKAIAEPASIAFATASSEAALPRAMENMEAFGVPRQMVAFIIPTGYSFNLDGSTLYLSLASVFVAQAAGIHMSFGEQLMMVLTLMLTSKGVAGVPRAAFVIMLATADSFHLPAWPIYAIFGVDQLMDMARTSINVMGNCLASAVVARWDGALGKESPSPNVVDAVAE
jgi:proton glutamate symport protein